MWVNLTFGLLSQKNPIELKNREAIDGSGDTGRTSGKSLFYGGVHILSVIRYVGSIGK
jgi:hypothetical protein